MEEIEYTNNLKLPLMVQNQLSKELTHNEALIIIDNLLQNSAIDNKLNTPPFTPNSNDLYIVAENPLNEWENQAKNLAFFDNGWKFILAKQGFTLWINSEKCLYTFDNGNWRKTFSLTNLEELNNLQINNLLENDLIIYDGTNFINSKNININELNLQNKAKISIDTENNLKLETSSNNGELWNKSFEINPNGDINFNNSIKINGNNPFLTSNNTLYSPLEYIDITSFKTKAFTINIDGLQDLDFPAFTKNFATFTEGGIGALIGTKSNSQWYDIFAITNDDYSKKDICLYKNKQNFTLPAGFTHKKLIGWLYLKSNSQIYKFSINKNMYIYYELDKFLVASGFVNKVINFFVPKTDAGVFSEIFFVMGGYNLYDLVITPGDSPLTPICIAGDRWAQNASISFAVGKNATIRITTTGSIADYRIPYFIYTL